MHISHRWQGPLTHLVLALAGASITLSLAPFRFWWTAPLACAVLAWGLSHCSPRSGFLRGWSFGAGMFLAGTSWVYVSIHVYGYASAPFAAFLTAAFCIALGLLHGLTGYLYCRWVRNGIAGMTLGFAAVWVLGEWLRSWLLTGFPWLYLGYAHIDTLLAGWAPVVGVLGISFIVSLSGAALAIWLANKRQWPPLAYALALVLLGASLQQLRWTEPEGAAISVASVQTNISQDQKWRADQFIPTLERYESMTTPLFADHDIVVWAEAAIPALYQNVTDFTQVMSQLASDEGSTLIFGIPYRENSRIYNSAVASGSGEGLYFKQRLVPFGEYVPLERWLGGLLRFFELPMSNFSSGGSGQDLLHSGSGHRLAPFICYEIAYPDLVARGSGNADILLTISNDGWFGRSFGPAQHMQIARMRALENGRQLIRTTGTGISALVDERGAIIATIPSHERGVLSGQVQPMRGSTPFSRSGSAPVILMCLLLALICSRSASRAPR